jgi:histidinol phosphatase-like enzyme
VELDQFFKAINDEKIASQVITKSAFFQSRKQVSYTAFVALNQSLINEVSFPWYILLVLLYLFEYQSTW